MNSENVKLIIAAWGALLSTILAVMKIVQDRKESAIRLFIDCREIKQSIGDVLLVFISNIWKRPITIIEISIGLGNDQNYQKNIYTHSIDQMLKLQESEPFKIEISKDLLMQKVKSFQDDDFMFMKLWLNVKLTSGKIISKTVYIDPKLYNISTNPRYDEYLAVAAFFKRDLMNQYSIIWSRKMKFEKR